VVDLTKTLTSDQIEAPSEPRSPVVGGTGWSLVDGWPRCHCRSSASKLLGVGSGLVLEIVRAWILWYCAPISPAGIPQDLIIVHKTELGCQRCLDSNSVMI
jgi:hypothetical protein